MTVNSVTAGNTMRSTVTFVPASGTVLIADVTARVLVPTGTTGSTAGILTLTPVAGATNVFYADIAVPDNATAATWVVRWESNSPSPKIALEDSTTRLQVIASALASP